MNILGVSFLALFIEGTITYLYGDSKKPRPVLKYVALVAGVLLAIAYKVDLLTMVGLTSSMPMVSYIITGVILGRGSNYLNDFITSYKAPAPTL